MRILTFQGTKEVNGNSNIEDKVYTITVFTPLCQYRISQKHKQGSGFKGCQRLDPVFVNVRQNFGNLTFFANLQLCIITAETFVLLFNDTSFKSFKLHVVTANAKDYYYLSVPSAGHTCTICSQNITQLQAVLIFRKAVRYGNTDIKCRTSFVLIFL